MQNLTSLSQSANGNITLKSGKTLTTTGALSVSGAVTLANTITNGTFVSAASGSGNVLSASKTGIVKVYADDGGVALTEGNLRSLLSRVLIDHAVTAGTFTMRGAMGQVKIDASVVSSGHIAGVEGYIESSASGSFGSTATGVRGVVDVPTGGVIASGVFVSGLMAYSVDLGGTHTGKAVALDVPTPGAGTWDALLHVGASTGCTTAGTTKTTPGGVGTWLNVYIDGTINYIPCYASTTT